MGRFTKKIASIPVSADGSVRLAVVSDTHSQPHPDMGARLVPSLLKLQGEFAHAVVDALPPPGDGVGESPVRQVVSEHVLPGAGKRFVRERRRCQSPHRPALQRRLGAVMRWQVAGSLVAR